MSIETRYQPGNQETQTKNPDENIPGEIERFYLDEQQKLKVLQALENNGFISYGGNNEVIANLDLLDQYASKKEGSAFSRKIAQIAGSEGFWVLQHAFRDLPVISQEDYDRGVREGKPLFYDPLSDEEALDINAIKAADFYLNPFSGRRKINYLGLDQVDPIEANMALLIYHPKYGNGYRDHRTGRLMVKDPIAAKPRPIRHDYFSRVYGFEPTYGSFKIKSYQPFSGSPNQFLQTKGKHLVEKGILTTADFRTMHRTGEKIESDMAKSVEDNGFVFIDGVRYYVGKDLKGAKAQILDDGTVLITTGPEEKIGHYFQLKPELRRESKSLTTLNAQETNLRPFDRQEYEKQREDETNEAYQKRLEALQTYELKPIITENLPSNIKAEMKAIARENWSHIDNPELGHKITSDLAQMLDENRPSRWYLAQANQELLGFIRFDDISDTEVYAGSLNVDEQSRGAQIGESILKSCLMKESQTKVVKGTAYPKLPIAAKYITPQSAGGYGFVATGLTYYEGTEVPFFQIEIDQKKNAQYHTGQMKTEDMISRYQNNQYQTNDDLIVLHYNPTTENDQMMIACNALLGSGERVMSGYSADSQDKNYRYLVFERAVQERAEALEEEVLPEAA